MTSIIFQTLGGLGIFLFGMKIMSEGLQKVAGKKIRQILGMVSSNRFIGCAMGAFVTSIIQSSSATTVMLVSFVDAGLMTLAQAVGVTLGANIGTTVTAQLIAFEITEYALPAIAGGVLLKFFLGRRKWIYVGDVLLGFGLVFFGLATMKAGFSPLKHDPAFIEFFTRFNADNIVGILLCVLSGTVLTVVIQSSSATVGITMAIASQGLLGFEASVAMILGDNIGTTITAELASIGASVNARRTARANTFFNVIGVINIILIFPLFLNIVTWFTGSILNIGSPDLLVNGESPNIARYIANSHTIFNFVNAVFFLVVFPYLIRISTWLTIQKKEDAEMEEIHEIKFIDSKYVDTPSVAIGQARAEIMRMGQTVEIMFDDVIRSVNDRKLKELSKWKKREDAIDHLQREITHFLVRVTQENITEEESQEVASLMRMTNNWERIGDEIEDIAGLIERLIDENLSLSDFAMADYEEISTEVRRFISIVLSSIKDEDRGVMSMTQTIEENVNRMKEEMKAGHIARLQTGACTVDTGLVFVDMLTSFEKIGGFCFNIAQAVAGIK